MAHHIAHIAAHHEHAAPTHGHGFVDTLSHGFAWRSGSDAANFLFHSAPGIFVLIVVVVLLGVGGYWLYNKFGRKKAD